jgi:hypothetical protein
MLRSLQSVVVSLARPTRITIKNKTTVKKWFYHIMHSVMNDPVS